MSVYSRTYAAIFHRRNQFRFPGNGRVSGNGEHQPPKSEVLQPVDHAGTTVDGDDPLSAYLPTEQSTLATVEGTVGTNPGDFLDLLRDPEHDKRATAIPAAREEA